MVTVADISLEHRDVILALPEGHFHDLKSKDIAPGKLTKTISGFANAAGGELYVGVDERQGPGGAKIRSWRGFADPEERHLQAFEQVSPLGTYVRPTFLRTATDSGLVLQLEVLKTREIVKATDDIAYVRRGAQNLPQTTEEQLNRLGRIAKAHT